MSTDLGTEIAYEQEYHDWLSEVFGCVDDESPDNSITHHLVDPHFRVISTANIPPQGADWWKSQLRLKEDFLARRLPLELLDKVMHNMDGFPMSMADAIQLRLELMEERKAVSHLNNEQFEIGFFSLCDHLLVAVM